MIASVTVVQTIFNQLMIDAEKLPDFVDSMVSFTKELEKLWLEMDHIEREFRKLMEEHSNLVLKETELSTLENRSNMLYIKILRIKIDFYRYWKPSFDMHKEHLEFMPFIVLVSKILNENMIPVSEGIMLSIRSQGEWIRTKKTEKIENRIRIMSLMLTLVVLSEVLIGCAQLFPTYKNVYTILAFLIPIIIFFASLIYYKRKVTI